MAALALEIDADTKRQMSPPGALGLNSVLEAKRLAHGLIDPCFETCASFDRIFVWQIQAQEKLTASGIVMPQASIKRVSQETPRGIVVSAGLRAMDIMRSNGMGVGDTVTFIRQGMWRITIGQVRGVDVHLMVLSVGDICSNEDLALRLRKKEVSYAWEEETSEHRLVDVNGKLLKPQSAWVGADYE
jgi:co-chaperonin GroES (HSP10)